MSGPPRVVAGLLRPATGEVRLDGVVVDERQVESRSRLSALVGPSAAYPDLTVYEHLLLIDASWGGSAATVESRVDEVLGTLRITDLADRFPHELSSGQQHLLDIALVLFRPGDLLVLDEPEQRLDADRRAMVGAALRERVERGATMVLATHDAELAERVADAQITLGAADRAEGPRG